MYTSTKIHIQVSNSIYIFVEIEKKKTTRSIRTPEYETDSVKEYDAI
jgi:hypothetical protein